MRASRLVLAVLSTLACSPGPAFAYDYTPAARRVLDQARVASGGPAWNAVVGWRESGTWQGAGYELRLDPLRYGLRAEISEQPGKRTIGYNGVGQWEIASSGAVTGVEDRGTLTQARTAAFFAAQGYLFPARFAAKGSFTGVRQHQGRSFDVLTIDPAGGQPRELWFDRRTRLLGRMIDRNGPRPVTVEISDYRKVGRLSVPFRYDIDIGDPARAQVRQVETVVFEGADRAAFSLPRSPPPPSLADK